MREQDLRRWKAANRQLALEIRAGSLHRVPVAQLPGVYEFQCLVTQASEVARGARYWLLELTAKMLEQRLCPVGLPFEQALTDYALLIDAFEASWQNYLSSVLRRVGFATATAETSALEACRKRYGLYVGLATRDH